MNIDHVATVRNARGGIHPCPVRAANAARQAGADGITAHLREDRRHIKDKDIERLNREVGLPLNLEMAATPEMLQIALKTRPHAVCLVPEKRAELTTEGGLNVAGIEGEITKYIRTLKESGARVSLFVDTDPKQIEASVRVGAQVVELHTGAYAEAFSHAPESAMHHVQALREGAALAASLGLEVHAGHGLDFANVGRIAAIPEIVELNIGHFLIGEAVFLGLADAIARMRARMEEGRAQL